MFSGDTVSISGWLILGNHCLYLAFPRPTLLIPPLAREPWMLPSQHHPGWFGIRINLKCWEAFHL